MIYTLRRANLIYLSVVKIGSEFRRAKTIAEMVSIINLCVIA